MTKAEKDCDCGTEKAEEIEEVKSEEIAVEVISPDELPDVVEEEIKEEEGEEEEELPEEEEKSNTEPSLDVVMKSLKKYGISVYAGRKTTPAPAIDTPKATTMDWNNVSKTWDELEEIIGDN